MALIFNTADLVDGMPMSAARTEAVYNGLDICVTYEVLDALLPQLDAVTSKTYDFSRALQAPMLEMMMRGLRINQNRKSSVLKDLGKKTEQLEEQLNGIVMDGIGWPGKFNWRSPPQLNELFYKVLGLPPVKKKNAQGIFAPTTNREAMESLSNYYIAETLCLHILALRDMQKAIGFLNTKLDPDGRMRTNFNIAGTTTGRLASSISDLGSGTNLQNVARDLRVVFMADPGMKFANLDLEQADSRNVGALCWNLFSERPELIAKYLGNNRSYTERDASSYLDACEAGDLHTLVCKMSNPGLAWEGGLTDREVADLIAYREYSYRDLSKKLGHGSNYVGQPPTMAKHAKIPVAMAKTFQTNYFSAFPCIPAWHGVVAESLVNYGQLTTLFGRRRYFFGRPREAATLREAVAYTPQSMTGDEINTGIMNLWRANRIQLLVQVHDSILFQYREEEENEIIPWALEALKAPLVLAKGRDFVVPTEAKIGWNWGEFDATKNPDGLKKWKGGDDRKRQEHESRLSVRGL